MKKVNLFLSLLILTLVSQAQMSDSEFGSILNQAQRQVSATNYEMTTFTNFSPIGYSKKIESGKWEVGLNSWGPNNTTSTQDLLKTVAIITLTEDGYTFVSATQPVSDELLERVQEYKFIKVAQKWLAKQMNYATVQYEWVDGRHVVNASSPADGKPKKMTDDLMNLLNVSRGMQNTVAMGVNKYK